MQFNKGNTLSGDGDVRSDIKAGQHRNAPAQDNGANDNAAGWTASNNLLNIGVPRNKARSFLGSAEGRSSLRRTKSLEARAMRERLRQEEEERQKAMEEDLKNQMEERRKQFDEETYRLSEEQAKVSREMRRYRAHTLQISTEDVPPLPNLSTLSPVAPVNREGFSHAVRWKYDVSTANWRAKQTLVMLGDVLCKPGRFRTPHWLEDALEGKRMVGKVFKEEFATEEGAIRKMCFQEAKIDMKAKHWAKEYNKNKVVPENVNYPDVYVYDVLGGNHEVVQTICGEEYFKGECVKYVDNKGDILKPGNNTVEAFIHFSYEASSHTEMVLDIQIIGGFYTDPLIATSSGSTGSGDFGVLGMRQFMDVHRCNGICYSILDASCLTKKLKPLAKGVVSQPLIDSFFKKERPPLLLNEPTAIGVAKSISFTSIPLAVVSYGGIAVAQLIDDTVKVVSLSTSAILQEVRIYSAPTAICSSSHLAFIGCSDGSIHVFDMRKLKVAIVLSEFTDPVHSMTCDHKFLFAASRYGTLKKWDIVLFIQATKFITKEISGPVLTVCDSGLFISTPSAIYWYDAEGIFMRYKFSHDAFRLKQLCVVDKKLIVADYGFRNDPPSLMLWDLVTREYVRRATLPSPVVALYPIADNKCLIAFENDSIQIWNVSTLAAERTLCEGIHDVPMACVFVDKDPQHNKISLLTCGDHLKVWTVK